MTVYTLIPFILAYVTKERNSSIPVYTFQMRVDTLYFNESTGTENITKSNAGLAFDLRCVHQMVHDLKCNIRKDIVYSPSTDPAHMVDNHVFTPSALNYSLIRFRMRFDINGAMEFRILKEEVSNQETLLDMYRLIGDQMSIGTNISLKGVEFNDTEVNIFGMCPTHYELSLDPYGPQEPKLRTHMSTEYFNLQDKVLRITKRRYVNHCYPGHGYILGKILWSDLILPSNLTVRMKESKAVMTFASDDFNTMSVNTFDLYDEENKKVGYVHESITLRFISADLKGTDKELLGRFEP